MPVRLDIDFDFDIDFDLYRNGGVGLENVDDTVYMVYERTVLQP